MLRQAREILASMERLQSELSDFARGLNGSIRILASLSALTESLPDDVGAFLKIHRSVRVSLDERVSSQLIQGVREGTADFGVCWDAGDLRGLETLPYRTDHLCVVVPNRHPLLRRKTMLFTESLAFDQIEIASGSIVQMTLRRAAALAGKDLRYRIQVSTFDAACRSIAAGLGIAVVPREVASAYAEALDLRMVPLADLWAERHFVICMRTREALSEVAGLLVDQLHSRGTDSVN